MNSKGYNQSIMEKASEQFIPRKTLEDVLRFWWVVCLLMLLGALLGWTVHLFLPPEYESHAEITVGVDFTRTGLLTDVEEDQAIVTVGDVINSSAVIEKVLDQAASDGMPFPLADFRKNSYLERENNKWVLRVRNTDPLWAQRLADLWSQMAFITLTDAYNHALAADRLMRYSDSLVGCMEESAMSEPVTARCGYTHLEVLLAELQQTSGRAEEEKLAGMGLLPALVFSLTRSAEFSDQAVRYGQGGFILAGALLGFCLAIWMMYSGAVSRIQKRLGRG